METITTNNNWKKKFIIIWTGQLFSILSSSIAQFSMVLWIGMETGSAEVLSYAAIAGLLPQILLGPMAGVFVDRWNRKWTMIGADSFVALCSAVIALLFYLDMVELWSIYLLLMLRSIGGAFHAPAMKSSIPLLAPPSELVRIAGINEVIQSVCTICGPMLGAALLLAFNMSVVMLLDVAGAFLACISLLFVFIPNPAKKETNRNILHEMYEGARIILRNRGMSWLMVSEIVVTFFVMPIVAVMPLMTLQYFNGTPYQVSLIEMLFGIGLLVGGSILGVWNPKIRKSILLIIGYFGLGLSLALCGALAFHLFYYVCCVDGDTRAGRTFIYRAFYGVAANSVCPFLSGTYLFFIRKYQPVSFCHRFVVNRIHSRQAGSGEYLYYRRYSDQYYRYIAVVQCFRSEFGAER